MNFQKRKIQKIRFSFYITLPVDWVKNMKIGKANFLNIEILDDQSLRITPVPQARQDSEGTGSATPNQQNEEVSAWKV
jgi:antitoxin MazE